MPGLVQARMATEQAAQALAHVVELDGSAAVQVRVVAEELGEDLPGKVRDLAVHNSVQGKRGRGGIRHGDSIG